MALPVDLDTSRAVLFLGSGFSTGATAIYGRRPPVGNELRDLLAAELGVDPALYDFKTLANAFHRRPELNLLDSFKSMFTISSVNQDIKDIIGRRWLRIYTTNYDDAVEVAARAAGMNLQQFNYDDAKPAKTTRNSIIHLHGIIGRANEGNLLDQLVLSQKTYIRQRFDTSSWYDEFRRDIRFCQAIFFVGYSLQDTHITALIPRFPEIKAKTYFITRGMPERLLQEDLEDYGEINPIEVSGFASACKNFIAPAVTYDPTKLKALKLIDIFKDSKSVLPPTANEIFDLIAFGSFNERRCLANLPEAQYIAPRQSTVSRALTAIKNSKTVVIHSRLGNGKTVFTYSLGHTLTASGYNCFRCIDASPDIEYEIGLIKDLEKVVIIFDNYDVAIACIDRLLDLAPDVKIVVNVRTGLQQVRLHELLEKLPSPLSRIDINSISGQDHSDFISLLESTGVVKDDLRNRIYNAPDIRDIVTVIYDNEYVRNRITRALSSAMKDKRALATITISLIMALIGQPADLSLFIDVIEADPFLILEKYKEEVSDIFDMDGDTIKAKSSTFAEYLVQHQLDVDDIMIIVHRVIIVAVSKKVERRYRSILSSMMSFAQLSRMLKSFPNAGDKIRGLYEKLQRDVDVREEPLFWLQYAIASTDNGRTDLAEGFLINAYTKAAANPRFQTYQLDTQALRLNLLLESSENPGQKISRIEKIFKHGEQVKNMISNRNHRDFAVKVLENYRPFITRRNGDIVDKERLQLIALLQESVAALTNLSPGARAETGADFMKADLELCLTSLATSP